MLTALKAYLEARRHAGRLVGDLQVLQRMAGQLARHRRPYGPEEKQALLEAPDLKARAEVLVALAEMELAAGAGGSGSTLQ